MPRYTFRMPISGTVEVTADGETFKDAVENYMAGTGNTNAEVDIDYIEDSDRAKLYSYHDENGNFIEV